MVAQVNRSIMHPVQIVQGVSNAPYAYRSLVQWFDCINFVRAIDPAAGSGSLLIRAADEAPVNANGDSIVTIFGQESDRATGGLPLEEYRFFVQRVVYLMPQRLDHIGLFRQMQKNQMIKGLRVGNI